MILPSEILNASYPWPFAIQCSDCDGLNMQFNQLFPSAASVVKDGVLNMSGPEMPKQPVTAKPAVIDFKEAFDYDAAVYRVRWSCSFKDQEAAWLASGGQTGIVRCQRVMLKC